MCPTGGKCPNDFSDPIDQDIHTQWALSWKIVVSEWRSVIAVPLNVGGGVRFIKPTKLCMWPQKHYKHNEDGRTAPGVCGNGSVPLSHSGNVVTRIGTHTHTHFSNELAYHRRGLCVPGSTHVTHLKPQCPWILSIPRKYTNMLDSQALLRWW